jgi:toxin ParE1/3/4
MSRVVFSRRAKVDLLEIWVYLAEHAGIETADRVTRTLYDRCNFLASAPGLGPMQPEIGPTIRTFSAKSYTIFFERRADGMGVLRVVHASRDWKNLF